MFDMIMPFFRKQLVEPMYYSLCSSQRISYARKLEKTQFLPYEVLIDLQWKRLQEIIRFIYAHNHFYRTRFEACGVHPDDIKSPIDMQRIPILTKREVRKHTPEMISEGFRREDLLRFKTGGSTGKALEIYLTEECSELRNACARRHDRWTGWKPGEPIGAIWGNPVYPKTTKDIIRDWLLSPMIFLDTMHVTDESVIRFAEQWAKARPTLLYGHAHSLYVLAEFVRRLGIDTIHPRGILSTSMMLMPHERRCIEGVFGIPVTDRYGCEEVSLIASECERHEGMHLNIEHLYIEFLKEDGCRAAPGETGSIVVTDLMNRAMPFIRYGVEDIGIPSDRCCPCGRGLPLMDGVVGRSADFLIRRDGSRVAGVSLIENTLTKIPGIDQMQIIQNSIEHIVLYIVPGSGFNTVTTAALCNYFRDQFEGINVDVRLMESIAAEPSGKYRFSICRVNGS